MGDLLAEGFYFRGCHSFILQSCPSLVAVFYARNSAVANVLTFAHTVQHTWDSPQMPAKGYLGLCDLLPTVSQGAALICTLTLLDGVASHVLSHPGVRGSRWAFPNTLEAELVRWHSHTASRVRPRPPAACAQDRCRLQNC